MITSFWLRPKGNERKLAWLSWDKMGRGNLEGGLGFRNLEPFNLVLLQNKGGGSFKMEHPLWHE